MSQPVANACFVSGIPKASTWCCKVAGVTYRPAEGQHPNWFHRLMHRLAFGARWAKDPVTPDGIALDGSGNYTITKNGASKTYPVPGRPDDGLKLTPESELKWSGQTDGSDLLMCRDQPK